MTTNIWDLLSLAKMKNIHECRKSLFGLLGPAYAYKCLLPPIVQAHLWRTYNLPILRSGLASLPIRPAIMGPLPQQDTTKLPEIEQKLTNPCTLLPSG